MTPIFLVSAPATPIGIVRPDAPAGTATPGRPIRFEQFHLDNGLRVLLAPDRSAPVVAVNVTYDVGSRDEAAGKGGLAHLLEHLMFQGSENVGKGEHNLLVSSVGGNTNATTAADRTSYYEALPANQLKLALFLEGDRMRSLDLTQTNLDNQRLVVKEERAQSSDGRGPGAMESLLSLAYTRFAYAHNPIGADADLESLTLTDVRSFYTTYYSPNNAVLTIAGDFDTETAKQLIDRYFGGISRRPDPPVTPLDEPSRAQGDERRLVRADPRVRRPRTSLRICHGSRKRSGLLCAASSGRLCSRRGRARPSVAAREASQGLHDVGVARTRAVFRCRFHAAVRA